MIEGDIHCLLVADIHVRFCNVLVSKLKELVDQTRATLTSMMDVWR